MDWRATEQVVDALGITNSESITAVSRALSYLGISTSYLDTSHHDRPTITLPIDLDSEQRSRHAVFEPKSKRWRLSSDADDFGLLTIDSLDARRSKRKDSLSSRTAQVESGEDDWTKRLPNTEHIQLIKNVDWSANSLGPMQRWPLTLRLMTTKMLADPRPACLYWGEDRIAIYNEPFVAIAFSRHPGLMGAAARDAMPATWPFLSQMFIGIETSGQAFSFPEFEMAVHKEDGILEEAWYDGVWSPVRGLDGYIEGFYNSGFEITEAIMLDRRNRLCHQIASPPNFHETTVWQHILDSCESHERDVTMLMLYSACGKEDNNPAGCQLRLEGSLGVPTPHPAAPDVLDLYKGDHGFLPEFRASKAQGSHVDLDTRSDRFTDLLDGICWRGHGEVAKVTVVIPIFVTGLIAGFAVIGLNPRVPYDEAHKQYVQDLGHVLTAALCESMSHKQALAREAQLSVELTRREKFIRKLTQVATVGIYSSTTSGIITYANSKFHDMTGTPEGSVNAQNFCFIDCILPDDRDKTLSALEDCQSQEATVSIDVRLTRKWTPSGSTEEREYWILNSVTPIYEDGEIVGTLGCLTDISQEVWALELQKNLVKSAEEAKKQQERFIDVTSHEMRNPLGAVMQCADSIRVTVEQHVQHESNIGLDVMESLRENAQTILFCTAHQKRIIDDILTVSKLDSTLLVVTPVLVEPSVVARNALQMFEGELSACDITSSFSQEKDISQAYCDPTRLTQILINLITNAIKFTKTSTTRRIVLTVGESTAATPPNIADMKWFPKRKRPLLEDASDHDIYLTFQVTDTGPGMTKEETARLFQRFSQVSPMTHVQYGGSGLGLYISRELTEMQGGMIGVSSVPGEGSTFGFFIKAQKATPSQAQIHCPLIEERRSSTCSNKRRQSNDEIRHVLLVEDNLINQKVLSKQLEKSGCTVHVANHGLEALEFIQKTRVWHEDTGDGFDLTAILMDWEMPICDGLTTTRRLRGMEQQGLITERLLIIMATANARPEQVSMALEAGADDLLAKPFTVAQAIKKIDNV